tara:strand:+ start:760 stop:900 length:141 start_codon:yes stop_codon:yes gene_type:complete
LIAELNKLQWWDWEIETIIDNIRIFSLTGDELKENIIHLNNKTDKI